MYPLHILKDGTIICGNQRFSACKELNFEKIPVKIINFDDERQIKIYAIKDNLLRRQLTPEKKAKPLKVMMELKNELMEERKGVNQYTAKDNKVSEEYNKG